MAADELVVYRERLGEFEEVGRISSAGGEASFTYAESYFQNGQPQSVSHALPLQRESFSSEATRKFFEGVLPEGSMRRSLSAAFHSGAEDYVAFLSRLNNETAGALVFSLGELSLKDRGYEALGCSDLSRFAVAPREFAPQAVVRSRLSLAGAQMKIGLFFDEESKTWAYPQGVAPSSHIVKASDGTFPGQTINEAICMKAASVLGFEVAECTLVRTEDCEPLIAVRRFDRADKGSQYLRRLHQEDFFQALPEFYNKYEPIDTGYANHCAHLINEECTDPVGARRFFFSRLLLDWALGNADNHLKNHSMLWSEDWGTKAVSPLYDLTCTTIYPMLDKEMGVSFGRSRRVDQVTRGDIVTTAKSCGVGAKFAERELEALLNEFPAAVEKSIQEICSQGCTEAEEIGDRILKSYFERAASL